MYNSIVYLDCRTRSYIYVIIMWAQIGCFLQFFRDQKSSALLLINYH